MGYHGKCTNEEFLEAVRVVASIHGLAKIEEIHNGKGCFGASDWLDDYPQSETVISGRATSVWCTRSDSNDIIFFVMDSGKVILGTQLGGPFAETSTLEEAEGMLWTALNSEMEDRDEIIARTTAENQRLAAARELALEAS